MRTLILFLALTPAFCQEAPPPAKPAPEAPAAAAARPDAPLAASNELLSAQLAEARLLAAFQHVIDQDPEVMRVRLARIAAQQKVDAAKADVAKAAPAH